MKRAFSSISTSLSGIIDINEIPFLTLLFENSLSAKLSHFLVPLLSSPEIYFSGNGSFKIVLKNSTYCFLTVHSLNSSDSIIYFNNISLNAAVKIIPLSQFDLCISAFKPSPCLKIIFGFSFSITSI